MLSIVGLDTTDKIRPRPGRRLVRVSGFNTSTDVHLSGAAGGRYVSVHGLISCKQIDVIELPLINFQQRQRLMFCFTFYILRALKISQTIPL